LQFDVFATGSREENRLTRFPATPVSFSISLHEIQGDTAQCEYQIQSQPREKRPNFWLNHCLLERPINVQQEIDRRLSVPEW
jgi:hypothetical protein